MTNDECIMKNAGDVSFGTGSRAGAPPVPPVNHQTSGFQIAEGIYICGTGDNYDSWSLWTVTQTPNEHP